MSAWSGGGSKGKPQAKGKGPSWLGSGAGKGPRKPGPMWKPTAQRQVDPESRQRAIRTTVAVTAVVLLAGFLYYLLTRPEPTPVIALRATAYPLQMPPLSFAEEDVALLAKISPHNLRVLPVEFSSSAKALDDFRKSLQAVGRQFNIFRRGAATVIVHVAAHGVVNEAGEACLVPPAADPFDSRTWLPVSQLFLMIRDEPALKGKNKLVLLDCQRVASSWRCGWLENRFADQLSSAVKAVDDPALFVITAASRGQTAWAAPELPGSVFGHFVTRAMKGEASSGGRSLSLGELFRYVAEQTNEYAQRRRGVAQQPLLLYADHVVRVGDKGSVVTLQGQRADFEDFTLAYVDRWQRQRKLETLQDDFGPLAVARRMLGGRSPDKSEVAAESSGYTLQQVWELYKRRRQPSAANSSRDLPGYVYDPVAWSSIQQRLAAIGERILAGQQYQGPALQTEIDKLGKELADDSQWTVKGDLPKVDLLQAASGQRATSGGENLFEAYWKAEPAKRREVLPRNAPLTRIVSDAYQALGDPAQSAEARQRLAVAAELLSLVSRPQRSGELIESHFITLLDRGLPAGRPLAADDLSTALKTRQIAEQAANPADVRAHYLVEGLVSAADEKRRQAEDQLFLGSDARPQQRLWSEASGDGNSAGYQAALRRGQTVAAMLALRDEIWSDLPLIAEFHFARTAAATESRSSAGLAALYEQSIELNDALERLLRSRDEEATFAVRFEPCQKVYESLVQRWPGVRGELESVYELPTNVEQAYRRATYVRDAELALRLPPMGGSSSQFVERYLQTLDDWAKEGLLAAATSPGGDSPSRRTDGDAPPSASSASSDSSAADERAFLRELHRVLSYEFVDPYEQHRHATPWDEQATTADTVFRGEAADSNSAWKRLEKLLDAYNSAIAQESPAWSSSQRSVAAATRLRQRDRRVRVAAHWLSSFQPDVRRPTQPTPARWLQQYDVAHLAAWHAYRAKEDFWGSGKPGDADTPFFAQAINQCSAVMPQALRPVQYDIPGGAMADFSEDTPSALAALRQWDAIQFPRSLNVSTTAGEAKIDIAIQPAGDGGKEFRLPPGTATLSFAAPPDAGEAAPRLSFEAGAGAPTKGIKLPLPDRSPFLVTAYVDRGASGQTGSGSAAVEARLWYRGHLRSKPCPLGPGAPQFIQYGFARPNYPPPTVEVQGKDTLRGAVLFIFDCSSSMSEPMRFNEAKRQLTQVLDRLANNAGGGLRVGLMAYGRRTKAFGSELDPDLFYQFRSNPGKTPQLTRGGEAMKERLGAQFFQSYPHPDRDVEELVRVADGTPAAVKAKLNELRESQAIGCTPLYYAIAQAIQSGFRGLTDEVAGARQIVVISDGVNMPYNCSYDERTRNYSVGQTGQIVANEDYALVDRALESSRRSVLVTVQLFGAPGTDFEKEQFLTLKRLDTRHDNFAVVNLPDPNRIAESIFDSFPKTSIELRTNQSSAAPQVLAFNQPQEVKDWGADGLLHHDLERRTVRLKLPGEERSLDQEVDLLGGERVVLQYNARETQLSFADDGLIRRGSGAAQPPRVADARKLLVDALDPERIGATINRFHFRIRDDDAPRRFAPRPKYVWLELKPRGIGGEAADYIFPCIDAAWKGNVNLPRLQVPVERWPDCPAARAQVWFRYSDPQALQQATIPRDQSGQTLSVGTDKWRVEQTGGEAGAARKITVIWQPTEPQTGVEKLLERAVWIWPPPDLTRRLYALDGTAAIHEFTYSRPEAANVDAQLRVVSRAAFQQGAYFAECEFDVAN